MVSHEEHSHRIMTELESGNRTSQRALSRDLGIALGLTNLLVRKLVRKGWVRVTHIEPNRVRYLLTPAGIAEKARMSRKALQNNVRYYGMVRDRISERFASLSAQLSDPAPSDPPRKGGAVRVRSQPHKRIVFYGAGEVAEIGYICLHRTDLRLVGVVDDHVQTFFGVPVHPRDQLRSDGLAGNPYDRLVVMSLGEIEDIRTTLAALEIMADRISWL